MRILHAIHDFLPRHRAGSEIYAHHLTHELARRHAVTILCAEYDPARPHGSLTWRVHDGVPVVELVNNWAFSTFEETYASPELNRSLRHVLAATDPDVLHVHNLLNLSMDLPALARERGAAVVATLHDYTLLCPSGGQRVHMAEQHVCHVIEPDRCSRCFPQSPFASQMAVSQAARVGRARAGSACSSPVSSAVGSRARSRPSSRACVRRRRWRRPDIMRRLDKAREVFDAIDLFVAPSQALADEYEAAGLPAKKLLVADYGFRPASAVASARVAHGRLRLGFVGTLVWHKGVHVLIEALRGLPADRVELKVFGSLDVFPAYVKTLREQARDLPVQFMGAFDQERAAEIYGQIDVLVVPSLWPENSPLVIHEAFMAGVPVVGARQGGIPGARHRRPQRPDLRRVLAGRPPEPRSVVSSTTRASSPSSPRDCRRSESIEDDAAGWEAIYERVAAAAVASPASRGA